MKTATAQALLMASIAVAARMSLAGVLKASRSVGNIVPNQFIIEVDSLFHVAANRPVTRRSLDAVYTSFQERAISFEVTQEYDAPDILVGAAVIVKTPQDAAALVNTPGVKAIRPIVRYEAPKPVAAQVVFGPNDPAVPPDTQSTHVITGVDKLHAEGITGSGIKIGIIDTGVDYTHPALGGGFGPEFKIVGGYDFVGPGYNGSNQPIPGPDPLDKCQGHGTHVAGIIGAYPNNPFNISGVAYEASLFAYRVFGCNGTVSDDILIKALIQGVKDGNDILTLSLGDPGGWTESTTSVVASRIAASGKIVTIAAGNEGASGAWYASEPGTGVDVISVASIDNTLVPLQSVLVFGVEHDPIIYYSFQSLPTTGSFPIYVISNDTRVAADACSPLASSTPDLSKYVTIIRRGSCPFVQKLKNVAAKGGNLVLFYDNGSGMSSISTGEYRNPALIQAADGEFLVNQTVLGVEVTLTFPEGGRHADYTDVHGGLVSIFSSYGPTFDFFFKPALGAPGGNILSTMPTNLGSYAVLSGTSMATPFVAGCAALVLTTKGKSKNVANHVRTLFQTTARVVPSSKTDGDPLQTVTQQGAGLINAYDAIHSTTRVHPGELILNDTTHFHPIRTFSVKNHGTTSKSYKVTHIPAGTALTVRAGTIFPSLGPVPQSNVSASVLLSPDHFSIEAGGTQIVTATFRFPTTGIDSSTFPVFSGFIGVAGSSASDSFHVSYLGLGSILKDKQVMDDTDHVLGRKLPTLLDEKFNVQLGPRNYTFVNDDSPTILTRFVFGTRSWNIDLVDKDTKFTPTISPRDTESHLGTITFPNLHKGGSFAQVRTVGSLAGFQYISRDIEVPSVTSAPFKLTSTFANGTTIPNGEYRILARALRVTGNPANEGDYESWLSEIFGVQVPQKP